MAEDNLAKPPPGERLCALTDIDSPGSKGFRFKQDGRMFAGFVVRLGDIVAGYEDKCPHAGWPLGTPKGYLNEAGNLIVCAGHGALFDLNGVGVGGVCVGEYLTGWDVDVVDGDVVTT